MNSHDTMSSSSRASETWALVKITPREKRLHSVAWGDFHALSRFARSTVPEGKWGQLVVYHFPGTGFRADIVL